MKFERTREVAVNLYGADCLTNHDLCLPTIKLYSTQNVNFFTNTLLCRPRKKVSFLSGFIDTPSTNLRLLFAYWTHITE